MSWSISIIGKPKDIVTELEAKSGKFTDQSKVEFDDAKPHLVGLVNQIFTDSDVVPVVKLVASGHGYARSSDGVMVQVNRTISVALDVFYGDLV